MKILKKSNSILFAITLVSLLIPSAIIAYHLIFTTESSVAFNFSASVGILLMLYYALLILVLLSITLNWLIKQIRTLLSLKNERIKAEMMLLQTEVNPHFFFNMLNNLYGLVEKNPKQAKQLILELSNMMRYSIYKGKKDFVALDEEIDFINNFIDLQKIRYHKKVDIGFRCEVDDLKLKIAPLLFIILIENAFKHGVDSLTSHAYVHIQLNATDQRIRFETKNNFEQPKGNNHGIGLKNLRRRLQLTYPNQSTFKTVAKDGMYHALLEIELS